MIKILFLINTLGGGGAERVMVNLINNMDKKKFDITVETMFADGINKDFLTPDVKYINKNPFKIRGLSNIIKFIPAKLLYKFYIGKNDYDIIVAYLHGAPTKVVSGCREKNTKKVAWLHNGNPKEGSFFKFWFKEKNAIQAYKKMDAIVGVSKSVCDSFSDYTKIFDNTFVLYNTNDTKKILELASQKSYFLQDKNKFIFCASGRLNKEKGFDRLINVSKKLLDEGFNFQIIIMGSGPEENNLIKQVKRLELTKTVKLLGFCENPYSVMCKSDAFISSSREEGLATVLTEALTLKMPIISTDVSGAKEVLGENNEYGLVVDNNENGIYNGMVSFLTDESLLKKYTLLAPERALKFNSENTVNKAEEFFENL